MTLEMPLDVDSYCAYLWVEVIKGILALLFFFPKRNCHNHKKGKRKPQPFPDTKRKSPNKQNQTSANQTNVRKAISLVLSFPGEVIAMLKGLKNTRTK